MVQIVEKGERREAEGREIDLRRVAGFFGSNWKFLALTTLVLAAAAIALSLILPQEYYKETTISVSPDETAALSVLPVDVAMEGETTNPANPFSEVLNLPYTDAKDAGDAAEDFLKAGGIGSVKFQVKFNEAAQAVNPNATTDQIDLVLQAPNKGALENIGPKVVEYLEGNFRDLYEGSLSDEVQRSNIEVDRKLAYYEKELEELDRRINEYPISPEVDPDGVKTTIELNNLADRRTEVISAIALGGFEKEYLRDASEKVPEVASAITSVQVLSESGVQGARPILLIAALALPLAFAVAVVAAVVLRLIRSK